MAALDFTLETTAIKSFEREPSGALLSPDEKHLATYRSGEILIWEIDGNKPAFLNLKAPCGIIHDLAFSPNGRVLAAATDESQIVAWSYPEGERLLVLNGILNKQGFFKDFFSDSHNQLTFSPDGKFLASQDNSGRPLIWETRNFTLFKHLDDPIIEDRHNTLAFSPDSTMLVAAHGHAAVLYDVHLGITIENFRIAADCLAFHHSRKQFAAGRRDKIVLFDAKATDIELPTPAEDRITSINNIIFGPEENFLLAGGKSGGPSAGSNFLYGWSLADGELMLHITPHTLAKICDSNRAGIHIISRNKILLVDKNRRRMMVMSLKIA